MKRRLISLKTRLSLTYGALSLALIGLMLLLTRSVLDDSFQNYAADQREQTAVGVVASIEQQLEKTSLQNMRFTELAYSVLQQGMILSVWDEGGKQVYCIHCDDFKACNDMLYSIQCATAVRDPGYAGTYMERKYPLLVGGQAIGSVKLGYSGPYFYTDADVAFMSRIDTVFLYAGIGFSLLAAGIGWLLARSIVRPIREIAQHTRDIGEGDYAQRVPAQPFARELSDLAQSVSGLASTLEAQQAAKQRMVRDYAHELRTPLSVLQANLEAFHDGIWEPTPERLGSCYEEIERLTRMLSHMEDLAQLYDPKREQKSELIDFSGLVAKCITQFEPVCLEKNITLSSQMEDTEAWGDSDKLRQVVGNLLSNAAHYTPQGGKITVLVEQNEKWVLLKVKDNGIGISPDDLPHVFDYLYRADLSRSRHTGGSGIGLSIVQKIVIDHGGEVTVESRIGEGSVFQVKLPVSK